MAVVIVLIVMQIILRSHKAIIKINYTDINCRLVQCDLFSDSFIELVWIRICYISLKPKLFCNSNNNINHLRQHQ